MATSIEQQFAAARAAWAELGARGIVIGPPTMIAFGRVPRALTAQVTPRELEPGRFYTVRHGRLKGETGRAFSLFGEPCEKLWFPVPDLDVSFCGRLHHLRPATDREELSVRRQLEKP